MSSTFYVPIHYHESCMTDDIVQFTFDPVVRIWQLNEAIEEARSEVDDMNLDDMIEYAEAVCDKVCEKLGGEGWEYVPTTCAIDVRM